MAYPVPPNSDEMTLPSTACIYQLIAAAAAAAAADSTLSMLKLYEATGSWRPPVAAAFAAVPMPAAHSQAAAVMAPAVADVFET